jgi:hypothetical protein
MSVIAVHCSKYHPVETFHILIFSSETPQPNEQAILVSDWLIFKNLLL